MSTKHEGLRAWSLVRRAKLLRYRKIGTSVRANERNEFLYYQLGSKKWVEMHKRHRMKG